MARAGRGGASRGGRDAGSAAGHPRSPRLAAGHGPLRGAWRNAPRVGLPPGRSGGTRRSGGRWHVPVPSGHPRARRDCARRARPARRQERIQNTHAPGVRHDPAGTWRGRPKPSARPNGRSADGVRRSPLGWGSPGRSPREGPSGPPSGQLKGPHRVNPSPVRPWAGSRFRQPPADPRQPAAVTGSRHRQPSVASRPQAARPQSPRPSPPAPAPPNGPHPQTARTPPIGRQLPHTPAPAPGSPPQHPAPRPAPPRHPVPANPTSCDRYHRSHVTRDLEAPRKQR